MSPAVTEAIQEIAMLPNRYHREERLQEAVAAILKRRKITFEEESVIGTRERIDFLLPGGLGIELKTQGSALAVLRQLYRYADHLEELVLVTALPLGIDSGALQTRIGKRVPLTVCQLWSNPT